MMCLCSAHNKCNLNTCSAKRAVGLHERPLLLDVNKKGKTEVRCTGVGVVGGGERESTSTVRPHALVPYSTSVKILVLEAYGALAYEA